MLRNWVLATIAGLALGLHPQDLYDSLQQEADGAGESRKALLRTERVTAGDGDWRELDVDANGVVSEPALAQQSDMEVVPELTTDFGAGPAFQMAPGLNPMEDAISNIMGDLMPYKEEIQKLNQSTLNHTHLNSLDPMKYHQEQQAAARAAAAAAEAEEKRKRLEQLQKEAHCWKECKGCHFKEAQPIEECFSSLEDAKTACAEEPPCSGVATQSKVCNGTWTMHLGSAETVEVGDQATLDLKTLTFDRVCLKNVQNANASKYKIHLTNKTWTEAEKLCAKEGLQLATPYTLSDVKALTAAMELKGAAKVHIGLRRDVQYGKGPWTKASAFYWVTGEKLEKDWAGWGGFGLAAPGQNLLASPQLPIKQPHLEAFLEGCCYLGYYQTAEEDGTKGVGDTTCDHFRIPFACQPIEEREIVEAVTTSTTTIPWHYGLAFRGSGSCPQHGQVVPVPLSQCAEAAANAVLPQGAKRGRTALQSGYDVGNRDPSQPWLGAPPGCSMHSGGDWAPVFNLGQGVNNGEYTPLCMQPKSNGTDLLAQGIEVSETAFPYDRSGKYFYFPAEEWEEKTGRDLSPHGSTQSISQYRHNFPIWTGIVRVWRNFLGVHGRREFNALPEQWQKGDLLVVGVMCPPGFSLVPYDLHGPDEMRFEATSLEGCAQKCSEVVRCSSFEFSHSESSCNTFTNSTKNFKAYLNRPNEWISCARADLKSDSTPAADAGEVSVATKEVTYAWKKSTGRCAFENGKEIPSGLNLGNMSLKECHESCQGQPSCTAYQMAGTVGDCFLHTSLYASRGSGRSESYCFIKPVLLSCAAFNSEDCAETYAVADHQGSTTEFCQKCLSSDEISLLRDRCQLCCEKCPMDMKTAAAAGAFNSKGGEESGGSAVECPPNTVNLDGDASNGCEVTCDPCTFANKTRNACQEKQEAPVCLGGDLPQRSCACFQDASSCEMGMRSEGTSARSCQWNGERCLDGAKCR